MIRRALIRLLGGDLTPPGHGEPQPDFAALAARVSALEDLQLKREVEWAEVSEKVLRYLRRIAAVEQRQKEREEAEDTSATTDPKQLAAVLKSKFHSGG
jgi:hypothetical protein